MKAIVWTGRNRVETVHNWPDPQLERDQILVRVKAAGICRTDHHMIAGHLDFAEPPWVLGHEMAGVVERVGDQAAGWKPGDRVIIDPVVSCGACKFCRTGRKYLCPDGGELGSTYGQGGYGEYVAVKAANLYPLPDSLSFKEGAMMEPLNCTMGAMHRVPNIVGANAAVFGDGPAGLLFTQLAKVYSASRVTLVGTQPEKLEIGRRLGADRVILLNSSITDAIEMEEGFDVTVDAAGSLKSVEDSFRLVAPSGTVVLYGLNGSEGPSIVSDRIVGKDLTIVTCISAPLLWDQGIRLTESGRIRVKELITERVPFDEAEELLTRMIQGTSSPLKAVIAYE